MFDGFELETLLFWAENSSNMLLISGPDGEIYWTNKAFRQFIKYSETEFTRQKDPVTWFQITKPGSDLNTDMADTLKCLHGKIKEYNTQEYYIPKYEAPVLVDVEVKRFPIDGDETNFKFFLVEVRKVTNSMMYDLQLKKIVESNNIRIQQIAKRISKMGWWYVIKIGLRLYRKTYNKYPVRTIAVILITFLLLLGYTEWASVIVKKAFNIDLTTEIMNSKKDLIP